MKPGNQLGLIRIIFFLAQAVFLARSDNFKLWSEVPSEFWHPNGLTSFLQSPDSIRSAIPLIFAFWRWTFPFLIVGFLYRFLAPLNAIAGFILINYAHSFGYQTHTFMPVVLASMVLAFSPAADELSLDRWIKKTTSSNKDRTHQLTIFNLKLVLCLVYFSAGLSKLLNGGWSWITGDTLRNYFITAYINYPDINPLARQLSLNTWLYDHPLICQVFAGLTILIELSAPLALLGGNWSVVIILALLGLQVGAFFTIFVNFSSYIVLYTVWIPFFYTAIAKRIGSKPLAHN